MTQIRPERKCYIPIPTRSRQFENLGRTNEVHTEKYISRNKSGHYYYLKTWSYNWLKICQLESRPDQDLLEPKKSSNPDPRMREIPIGSPVIGIGLERAQSGVRYAKFRFASKLKNKFWILSVFFLKERTSWMHNIVHFAMQHYTQSLKPFYSWVNEIKEIHKVKHEK